MTALDEGQVKEGVDTETVDAVRQMGGTYKHGWETDIEMDYAPKGLNEDIVRLISAKNNEPEWLTEWRLEAYRRWTSDDRARLGDGELPPHRLPGAVLLRQAEIDGRKAQVAGRCRSQASGNLCRSWASR